MTLVLLIYSICNCFIFGKLAYVSQVHNISTRNSHYALRGKFPVVKNNGENGKR